MKGVKTAQEEGRKDQVYLSALCSSPHKILSQQNMSLSQSNITEIKAIQIRFLPSITTYSTPKKYLVVFWSEVHSIAAEQVYYLVISFVSSPPIRYQYHAGTFSLALCAYGWQCPQLCGPNGDCTSPLHPLAATDMLMPLQRSTASSSRDAASEAATSPFRLTLAGTATTAVAIGSMAWYYHLYGSTLYAMTPAEEGSERYTGSFNMIC